MHWLCLKNERFNVSLRRISLIHKSTYVFVEFVILHSYRPNKKYANIFDHFKFKRDFFFFARYPCSEDQRILVISEFIVTRRRDSVLIVHAVAIIL